jgi:hypothetical protein
MVLAGLAGLGVVLVKVARRETVTARSRLPLGSLLAGAAITHWMIATNLSVASGLAFEGAM